MYVVEPVYINMMYTQYTMYAVMYTLYGGGHLVAAIRVNI